MWRPTFLLLFCALLAGTAARADVGDPPPAGETATLTARSSGSLPRDVTIEIQTADENPEYADLVPIIERGLLAHDLVAAPGGTYVLRFGYRLTAIPEAERDDPNFSIVGKTGTASRSHMQMQLRLRNEEKGSRGNDLLMTFELYQPGAPPLWHATVQIPEAGFDRSEVLRRVTETTVDLLGKTGTHNIPLE